MRSLGWISMAVLLLSWCQTGCGMDVDPAEIESSSQELINGQTTGANEYRAIGKVNSYYCDGIGCWFGIYSGVMCTGTLIAPDVVLSAGHCVHDLPNHKGYYVEFKAKGRGAVRAKFWTDYYTQNGAGDDLVLMVLKSPINDIDPMYVMESDDSVAANDEVTHVGYGCNTTSKTGAGTQRDGVADVVYASTSSDTLMTTRDNNLSSDVSGCEGDSGGPVIESFSDGKKPAERLIGVHHARDYQFTDTYSAYLKDHRSATINPFMRYHCNQGNRDSSVCQDWKTLPEPTCGADYSNCLQNSDCCSNRCVCAGQMGNTFGYCCPSGKSCKFC